MSALTEGIDNSIDKWSSTNGLDKSAFREWRSNILNYITQKIEQLKQKIQPMPSKPIMHDDNAMQYLTELQEIYVMVPIDKAVNNVAFICKRFYAAVLLKELGVLGPVSLTYQPINLSKEIIIN